MQVSRHGGSLAGILVTLVIGGLLGAGIAYYLSHRAPAAQTTSAAQAAKPDTPAAQPEPAPAPASEDYISRKLREWNLTPEDLKRDLATAGKIVREKGRALGDKVANATSDVAIITKIKAKFALDDHLQALKITVGCKDGHVTLSGTVAAPDLIGRAIVLALDTEGVADVVSSLKVTSTPEPV